MMSCAALHNEALQTYVTMQDACFMHCMKRRNRRLFAFRGHSTVCQGSCVMIACGQELNRACTSGAKPQELRCMDSPKMLKPAVHFCLCGQRLKIH